MARERAGNVGRRVDRDMGRWDEKEEEGELEKNEVEQKQEAKENGGGGMRGLFEDQGQEGPAEEAQARKSE